MKRLILLFVALFAGFLGSWTYKLNQPVNRPDEYAEGVDPDAGQWWNSNKTTVDEDWTLDPTIPANYVPVPGEENLFMVVDNDGNILEYRKRTKQPDGSWLWETVNPDIPENYEPVEGLENVYRVKQADGSYKYYKYIRNQNDTFAWVEVDENGNEINKNTDATRIDGKHVHVSGNLYKRLDANGVVIGYDKRMDNGDGTFSWMDYDASSLGGLGDLSGSGDLAEGFGANGTLEVPEGTGGSDALSGALSELNDFANSGVESGGTSITVIPSNVGSTGGNVGWQGMENYQPNVINNADGTHTETKTIRETKTENGIKTTYETKVETKYDDDGNVISTNSIGPVAVDSQGTLTRETELPNASKAKEGRASTLSEETTRRKSGSITYDDATAKQVYALLNAYRAQNGIAQLAIDDTAVTIARLRAADMATYQVSDGSLPTYGTLGRMLSDYGVTGSAAPGETLWMTIAMSASEINDRFQAIETSRKTRTSTDVTKYGIAVAVDENGKYYICEVVL